MIEINAITLHCSDMTRSFGFYRKLGFDVAYGGADSPFTSLRLGANFVNLQLNDASPPDGGWGGWGRVVFHVERPDETYQRCLDNEIVPVMEPSNAPWGERYFHVRDPDGHELSFARPLDQDPVD